MKRYIILHDIEKELDRTIEELNVVMAKLGQLVQSAGVTHNPVEDILFQGKAESIYLKAREARMVASETLGGISKLSKSLDVDGDNSGDKIKYYNYII